MWRGVWFLACVCLCRSDEPPSATISQGRLKGAYLESRAGRRFNSFLGIPYAAPPLGELRFQKPQPAESWEGVHDATKEGNPCVQSNHTSKGLVFGSEDCLYLNVFTHKVSNESKDPVLVYIHGGGFMQDWGSMYRPDFLMDKDIVFVTINYRLGALGFLSMEDKVLPGNNGLKDQVLALKWVRDNIAQFGGDPSAVTILGESAGAACVHFLMLSPLAKGLFHRAIAQSGSAYCPWASHAPRQLRIQSELFASQLGCNHHSTHDTLECLRDIPAYVLVEIMHGLHVWQLDPIIPFPPAIEPLEVEDAFLTTDPWKLTSDIPWIAGVTAAEGSFKANTFDEKHIAELNNDFEMIGPLTLMFRTTAEDPVRTAFTVKKFYFFDSDIQPDNLDGLTDMYSDSWFIYPVKEAFRRHRGPKYFYYFNYRGANSIVPSYKRVSHFDDMQYIFPMDQYFRQAFNATVEDRKMSQKLVDFWTNFVIHGKPTLETSDVTWNEAATGTEYLHISQDGFTMEKDLLKQRDEFWSALPYRDKYVTEEKVEKDEL